MENLEKEIVSKVEKDLRCYPDWLIRIECPNLGTPSKYGVDIQRDKYFDSYIENEFEISEEIKLKVEIIERVYDRLHGKAKNIIEYRYFQDYRRGEVINMIAVSKRGYYNLRDRAIECFARALGYID